MNGILPRVGVGGSFRDKADRFAGNAINARSAMHPGSKTKTKPPGHTVGGGIMAGMGGAAGGAVIGAEIGAIGGPWGAAIGAILGTAAYYLS